MNKSSISDAQIKTRVNYPLFQAEAVLSFCSGMGVKSFHLPEFLPIFQGTCCHPVVEKWQHLHPSAVYQFELQSVQGRPDVTRMDKNSNNRAFLESLPGNECRSFGWFFALLQRSQAMKTSFRCCEDATHFRDRNVMISADKCLE